MPETYRRGRIAEYVQRLIWRKAALVEQLELPELAEMMLVIQGRFKPWITSIREMIREYEIQFWFG